MTARDNDVVGVDVKEEIRKTLQEAKDRGDRVVEERRSPPNLKGPFHCVVFDRGEGSRKHGLVRYEACCVGAMPHDMPCPKAYGDTPQHAARLLKRAYACELVRCMVVRTNQEAADIAYDVEFPIADVVEK